MLRIEIDEHQHRNYIKYDETIKYDNLFTYFSGKDIFIRYSPDKFTDEYNTSKNPFFQKRMELLEDNIEKHIHRIEHGLNTDLIEIHHLFYTEI